MLALQDSIVRNFADVVARYLRAVETEHGIKIVRIAIDAPSAPRRFDVSRRDCEFALDRRGMSCITTPTPAQFAAVRERALQHLHAGRPESRLPGANLFWMLVGFALFERLSQEWECLEVYPHAIAHVLGASAVHKRFEEGLLSQLRAVARRTGWPPRVDPSALDTIAHGAPHDRLDAYLACWVASLEEHDREALGTPPHDAIWVPSALPSAPTLPPSVVEVEEEPGFQRHPVRSVHRSSAATTTIPGFVNRNRQQVVRATGLPGTDRGQSIYVVRCGSCRYEYGVNGSGIFQARCPRCDRGTANLAFE